MKQSLASTLAVLLLTTACGGGGSGNDTNPTPLPSGPSDPAVIQQVLEDCALGQLEEIQAAIALFQQFLDPTATPPTLVLTGETNLLAGVIGWSTDVDTDGTPDFTGTFRTLTAGGSAINLIPIVVGLGGSPTPAEILAALPDDAQVETTFEGALPPDGAGLIGTLRTQFVAGVADTVTGSVTASDPGCSLTVDFEDVPVADLSGEIPSATYDLTIVTLTETLTGQATFDGTDTALIELAQAGRDPVSFTYDLATEILTPVA